MRLVFLRIKKKLTQKQVADKIGVSQQQYQQWESGKINPTYPNLLKIAKVFGCTLNDLAEESEL